MRQLLLTAAFLACTAATAAQEPAAPQPVYDQVAITVSHTAFHGATVNRTSDTYTGYNVSLRDLIAMAYNTNPELIFGLPGAADTVRFDINAHASAPPPSGSNTPMLKALLTDHFGIQAHKKTQNLPVYSLTVAPGGLLIQPLTADQPHPGGTSLGNGDLAARGATTHELTKTLNRSLDRPVVDNTGLTAAYTFQVHYNPADATKAQHAQYIATALAAGTGLQLTPTKAEVKTLTIEHIDLTSIPGAPKLPTTASAN